MPESAEKASGASACRRWRLCDGGSGGKRRGGGARLRRWRSGHGSRRRRTRGSSQGRRRWRTTEAAGGASPSGCTGPDCGCATPGQDRATPRALRHRGSVRRGFAECHRLELGGLGSGLLAGLKLVAHARQRARQTHAHCALPYPEHVGQLRVFQAVTKTQHDEGALTFTETPKGSADVVSCEQHLRWKRPRMRVVIGCVIGVPVVEGRTLLAAQMVDATIASDGQEPRARRGIAPESLQRSKGGAERVLGKIVCRVARPHHGATQPDDVPGMPVDEPTARSPQVALCQVVDQLDVTCRAHIRHRQQLTTRRRICHSAAATKVFSPVVLGT